MSLPSVSIVGTGRVAHHLLAVLSQKTKLIQLIGRNKQELVRMSSAYAIPWIDEFNDLLPADVTIMAVSDDAIPEVAKSLSKVLSQESILCHTSGTRPLNDISQVWPLAGIFYPLQTFSKERKISFDNLPMLITASKRAVQNTLTRLGRAISKKVIQINDADRKHIHLAAVIINNHINHLLYLAKQYCEDHHLEFELLQPLLEETIQKASSMSPFHAQTGPARRTDEETITEHIELLENYPLFQELYHLLSESILLTYHNENS